MFTVEPAVVVRDWQGSGGKWARGGEKKVLRAVMRVL